MSDPINPDHYKSGTMEVIDVIDAFKLSFYEGQVVKYVMRWKKKNGLEDLQKAQWYINRLIAIESQHFAKAQTQAQGFGQGLTGVGGSIFPPQNRMETTG